MAKIYKWFMGFSKRVRDSISISVVIVGMISTVFTIIGVSLANWITSYVWRICAVIGTVFIVYIVIYVIIGRIFKDSINLYIRKTPVSIKYADIFGESGLKVIGCDTHFDTRVDDIVISKKSLQGQMILNHGKKEEIEEAVRKKAKELGISEENGMYEFPLGTIIRYDSGVDHQTYLMLAMTKLNDAYENHTNMAEFENTLMTMWKKINGVYSSHNVVLPLLGTGITRFDGGPMEAGELLRCMLCTLHSSGVSFNSEICIVIYDDVKDVPLYEYKCMFHGISRR